MKRLDLNWSICPADDFKILLKRFRSYLEDFGFRNSTIEGYVGNVGRYLRFAETGKPSLQDAASFRDALFDKKLSRSTVNQYSYAIRVYHKMMGEELQIRRLNLNNDIPYYFTVEEVQRIFAECRNLKHLAMLQTMFYGCLRASELCDIDDQDVDLKNMTITVRCGKGGRGAVVFISDDCVRTLKQYLAIRPPLELEGREPLFYTDYGNRWNRTEIHRMFTCYKKRAGIEKVGGVHVFGRHSVASILVANGCDLRHVKELMRHKDIRTTLRYAHVGERTLREKYDRCLRL